MKFIKLTDIEDNEIFINMQKIIQMEITNNDYGTYTRLFYGDYQITSNVKETPEEIIKLLDK